MSERLSVVIVDAVRTPLGSFGGALADIPAPKLGSHVIKSLLQRTGLAPDQVDEVIMGCVLPANTGMAPARQAALGAGLPDSVECMTINKVCGSGLKAVMLAAQAIQCGDADVIIAGGMENMSQAPFYLQGLRNGLKMGHSTLIDSMLRDGLWDVYDDTHMGSLAELCAAEYRITREAQDEFAIASYRRAQAAQQQGLFKDEIAAVPIPQKKGDPVLFDTDEEPGKVNFDKLKTLRPVFQKEGTVTAANASSINDGAAAVLLMSAEKARALGLQPRARIVTQAAAAKSPQWFTTAPADAIAKVLKKAGLTTADIDLFEINEAFAVVSIVNNQLLGLAPEKVNVHGGAVALGHPLGASGARILATLLNAMQQRGAKRGLASLCIGGGEAVALIVETI
ncbi:MAG TPA: acetyl-CoA C-acetyltransferase [bacterium]|nr:acetyl-CoA C-acetyltransferase [bacterium]HPR89177.1 acetyl-CoA C-acetyltransferase [bacterium]